jgi:hypothetical protein
MRNPKIGLDDLLSRGTNGPEATKLMNVKVPTALLARIAAVATTLRAKKTDVVIAILNEGLAAADSELKGWKPPPKPVIAKARRCTVASCERERTAKGLCMAHYVAQRRAARKAR